MRKKTLVLLIVMPTVAFAQSREAQERQEVISLFGTLLPKFDVRKGDGIGSDLDCVFTRKWDQSFHRDTDGEPTDAFQPRELLTLQQALDPSGRRGEMFCDYSERDAHAQELARDRHMTVSVANVGFSYPDFSSDLRTATVYYQRWSQIFLEKGKRDLPVGSNGVITLKKHEGTWSFKSVTLGTMN